MEKLLKPILLTGMKHCGKSSTAGILAKHFSALFIDLDDAAEKVYAGEYGRQLSSREIYRTHGRETFQLMEEKAAEAITSQSSPAALISAAGGGLCDNIPAVNVLKEAFCFIYIDEDADVLYNRIIRNGIPAFLSPERPYEDFLALYKRRTKEYQKLSNIHIKAGGRSSAAVADEIINKLMEDGYAG